MDDALRRAIRTFVQGFIGVLIALQGTGLISPDTIPDIEVVTQIILSAIWGGVIAVLSWIQNELEDHGKIKPLLKG